MEMSEIINSDIEDVSFLSIRHLRTRVLFTCIILSCLIYLLLIVYIQHSRTLDTLFYIPTRTVSFESAPSFRNITDGTPLRWNGVTVFLDVNGNSRPEEDEQLYSISSGGMLARTLVTDDGMWSVLSTINGSAVLSAFPRCALTGNPYTFHVTIQNPQTAKKEYSLQVLSNDTLLEETALELAPLEAQTIKKTFVAPESPGLTRISAILGSLRQDREYVLRFWMRVASENEGVCSVAVHGRVGVAG
ncbi:MAG: hypothetical protein QF415_17340 [Candidatus Undinarchaeales archaeon]|jgi:hypothetical protein|nr:hypothetical protein [Candidatus Undinarchaeales archaeon]